MGKIYTHILGDHIYFLFVAVINVYSTQEASDLYGVSVLSQGNSNLCVY